MLKVQRVGKRGFRMTESGKKSTATVIVMIPRHRMKITVLASAVTAFIYGYEHIDGWVQAVKVIPFVVVRKRGRQFRCSWVQGVYHMESGVLWSRMIFTVSAGHSPIPPPIIFAIRCRVYAYKPAARLYISFKSHLLVVVEHIARRTKKDYGRIIRQCILVKPFGVGGRVYIKPMFRAKLNERLISGWNRRVIKCCCFAKNQHPWFSAPLVIATYQINSHEQQDQKHQAQ